MRVNHYTAHTPKSNDGDLAENEHLSTEQHDSTLNQAVTHIDPALSMPLLNDFINIDGLIAFDDADPDQSQELTEVPMVPYDKLDFFSQSWCGWMRRGVPLSMVMNSTLVQSNSDYATILRLERPVAQQNATLIIQSLRSFPSMMLRRESFPWHIHRQAHTPSESGEVTLSESLSNCMSIAQMFVLRTPETKPFLWRTIRTEYRRVGNEVSSIGRTNSVVLTTRRCIKCPSLNFLQQYRLA
jgi:hypothetical protein